jgi:hypothetical protein
MLDDDMVSELSSVIKARFQLHKERSSASISDELAIAALQTQPTKARQGCIRQRMVSVANPATHS